MMPDALHVTQIRKIEKHPLALALSEECSLVPPEPKLGTTLQSLMVSGGLQHVLPRDAIDTQSRNYLMHLSMPG